MYPKSTMEVVFFRHSNRADIKSWIEAASEQFNPCSTLPGRSVLNAARAVARWTPPM